MEVIRVIRQFHAGLHVQRSLCMVAPNASRVPVTTVCSPIPVAPCPSPLLPLLELCCPLLPPLTERLDCAAPGQPLGPPGGGGQAAGGGGGRGGTGRGEWGRRGSGSGRTTAASRGSLRQCHTIERSLLRERDPACVQGARAVVLHFASATVRGSVAQFLRGWVRRGGLAGGGDGRWWGKEGVGSSPGIGVCDADLGLGEGGTVLLVLLSAHKPPARTLAPTPTTFAGSYYSSPYLPLPSAPPLSLGTCPRPNAICTLPPSLSFNPLPFPCPLHLHTPSTLRARVLPTLSSYTPSSPPPHRRSP